MTFTLLRSLLTSDDNYKNSGLPKFIKHHPRIFEKIDYNNDPYQITSLTELQQIIHEKYNSTISINKILQLFVDYNIIVSESVTIPLSVAEVNEFREYDRSKHIYCSKRTPEQYDQLYEDIKQNGIKQSGRIRVQINEDGYVEAILGEGNHRLSIAKLLQLSTMPIVFRYII